MFEYRRADCVRKAREDGDLLRLAGVLVVTVDLTLILGAVADERIGGPGSDVSGFAASCGIPIGLLDGAIIAAAGDGDGAVVLLRAEEVVRISIVGDHVVELRRRLIVLPRPALAGVERDGNAAVIRCDHALRIFRTNPQAVIVAVRQTDFVE